MSMIRLIILAAQRPGVVDPLAMQFGVSHKCLAPLAGKPLIAHVLATAARHSGIADVAISIEADLFGAMEEIIAQIDGDHAPIMCVASADNLTDSVIAAASGHKGPAIITTADNALLSPEALDAMAVALAGSADVAIAMARKASVLSAHPDGQRRFYRFADDAYSNCNLYGIAGAYALGAAEMFRGGGQFAKKVGRIIDAFGLINLILLRLRLASLEHGLKRISRRLGLSVMPVILTDGRNAIDVDNERTYAIVADLIGTGPRAAPSRTRPLVARTALAR
jgi:GTP:adenosylcobinamide-phosphate guanylyltransferase